MTHTYLRHYYDTYRSREAAWRPISKQFLNTYRKQTRPRPSFTQVTWAGLQGCWRLSQLTVVGGVVHPGQSAFTHHLGLTKLQGEFMYTIRPWHYFSTVEPKQHIHHRETPTPLTKCPELMNHQVFFFHLHFVLMKQSCMLLFDVSQFPDLQDKWGCRVLLLSRFQDSAGKSEGCTW